MEAIVNAVSELFAAVLGRFGLVGRARSRANIRHDLDLLNALQSCSEFDSESETIDLLRKHINAEVARYTGASPTRKKPWSAIALAAFIAFGLGLLAYLLSADGFDWFSIPVAAVALLMVISIIGMLTSDEDSGEEKDLGVAVDG